MKKIFLISLILTIFSLQTRAFAQDAAAGGDAGGDPLLDDAMTDVYTVAGIGAMGAILGLSTLSFVEEPKEHLKNILIGGSIGVIVGVGVVAWRTATKSKDIYEENALYKLTPDFNTINRYSWHKSNHNKINGKFDKKISAVNYNFSF